MIARLNVTPFDLERPDGSPSFAESPNIGKALAVLQHSDEALTDWAMILASQVSTIMLLPIAAHTRVAVATHDSAEIN